MPPGRPEKSPLDMNRRPRKIRDPIRDPELRAWREAGAHFGADGTRLFYRDEGRGEAPLLLLHAYPTGSWGWRPILPALARRGRVVAPDLPGSGLSDKPSGRANYAAARLADQVAALVERLDPPAVHIWAHAYGSCVAQELVARAAEGRLPFRVASICFMNAGLFPEVAHLGRTQRFLLTKPGGLFARLFPAPRWGFFRNFPKSFGPATRPSARELARHWELMAYQRGHRRAPEVMTYLVERKREAPRWLAALEAYGGPAGLISGLGDPIAGRATSERWRERFPNRPLIEFDEGVGHYPPLERPKLTLGLYERFRERARLGCGTK